MQSTKLLYNWQAVSCFLPYLSLIDMLKTATLSKQWKYNLEMYLKTYVLDQQQADLHHNVFKTVKLIYNRKLYMVINNQLNCFALSVTAKEISVSRFVIVIKTFDNRFFISNHLHKDKPNKSMVALPKKFTDVRCIKQFLYCLHNHQITRYQTNSDLQLNDQQTLSFPGTIDCFVVSVSGVLVCYGQLNNSMQYSVFMHHDMKEKKVVIDLPILNPSKDIILNNITNAYIISEGVVYQANLEQAPCKPTQLKMLKGKNITEIKTSYRHHFAFETKQKPLKFWSNSQVTTWLEQSGLGDYAKIFKVEKVTGQKLLNINKIFMQDRLGITSIKTQQKLKMKIDQVLNMDTHPENFVVYGWGRNDKGQLCTNPSSNVSNAMKIKLPEGKYVWSCAGSTTFLKDINNQTLCVNTLQENKLVWEEIIKSKVWGVGSCTDALILLASATDQKMPQRMSEQPISTKKQKFRTVRNVIDRVEWDQNLRIQDFVVGYADRFEGTLETSLSDFLKGEIKQYQILYFKQRGKVVWDKKLRIDIL